MGRGEEEAQRLLKTEYPIFTIICTSMYLYMYVMSYKQGHIYMDKQKHNHGMTVCTYVACTNLSYICIVYIVCTSMYLYYMYVMS